MAGTSQFSHLARYNGWMNGKLYGAAAALPDDELRRDRGAFFGSILATLQHIMVADVVWFKRMSNDRPGIAALRAFDDLPMPASPVHAYRPTLPELAALRAALDDAIVAFCTDLTPAELAAPVGYASGVATHRKLLADLLLHAFNHQTHHRGQVTTLFSQMGIDVGDTDLLLLLPDAT